MGSNTAIESITGLILAGGQASRMHHVDKGLQHLNGKTLVEHVIERIRPQVVQLAINANRHLDQYQQYGLPVWPDRALVGNDGTAEFRGPLAGIESGLSHCRTPYLLIVPCDSPYVPTNLVEKLYAAIANHDIAVATTGTEITPTIQPVFSLIKGSLLPHLKQYLQTGARKITDWYQGTDVIEVFFPDGSAFTNINTLEDLLACSTST